MKKVNEKEKDAMIGLEVHITLLTKTKLFCGCETIQFHSSTINNEQFAPPANSFVCPVCLGHPGTKPVLNSKAFESSLKLCIALNCTIAPEMIFSRKCYFYPDLSKNYQITQFEEPLGRRGKMVMKNGNEIELTRIHLEEDPASIEYPETITTSEFSLIDYNRAGNPLCEIVTAPNISSPQEAREALNQLITILEYLGIFDHRYCSIKADANISIKESNFTRVEVKNITSFKEIEQALMFEIARQRMRVKRGLKIERETRSWDAVGRTTKLLRTKETEEDYGYIFDPDLCLINIKEEIISNAKENIPELPSQKMKRFVSQYKISQEDSEVLASDIILANIFEEISKKTSAQLTAKWLRRELLRVLNYAGKTIKESPIKKERIIELIKLMQNSNITEKTGQRIMELLMEKDFSPNTFVEQQNLRIIAEAKTIRQLCEESARENQKAVKDFKNGKKESLNYLVGIVMKKSNGKAEPEKVREIIVKFLNDN